MIFKRIAPLALAFLGLSCGLARAKDPIILSLGAEQVRRSDFDSHVRALEAKDGPLDPAVRRSLLESFLEERVLVIEARTRGLLRREAAAQEEQAAVQKLLADAVNARLEVTDQETADYFGEHRAEFRVPEGVTLRQILVPTENEAREALRRLQKDPKSFETMARTLSRAPEASTGGVMGTFSRGQLPPDLEAVAFSLAPGGYSDVVKTPLGFHVLRVDARQPARERTLEECRETIRAQLLREKSDRATKAFVRELLARAKVNHEAATAPKDPA